MKKIIILLIFIITLILSNTYASITEEEMETKLIQIINQTTYQNEFYRNYISNFLNSQVYNQYKSQIPFDNYINCFVRIATNDQITIFLFNETQNVYVDNSGWIITPTSVVGYAIRFNCDRRYYSFTLENIYNDYTWTANSTSFFNVDPTSRFTIILTNVNINNQYNKTIYGMNYTATIVVPNRTTYVEDNTEHRLGEGFIGQYYYDNRNKLQYKIYDQNNNEYTGSTRTQYTSVTNGENVNLFINTDYIISGNTYYIDLYYNQELLFQYGYGETLIIRQNQTSGDNTSGEIINIDLTETNQKLDNIENAIISGDNKIIQVLESGEQKAEERQTFWEKAYNDLFIVSGDVIEDKITNLYNELELPSGELAEALAGLDIIGDNSEDFKISWQTYTPNFSIKNQAVTIQKPMIPSGEVNFSKIERENETFKEVMKYTRAILGFSIIVLLTKNFWQTLLATLGISTQIYDKATAEKRAAQAQEEKWKADLEKQRYNEWLRKNSNRK